MDSSHAVINDATTSNTQTHQDLDSALRTLRRNLNQLRREARKLDHAPLENCLTLAITLTASASSAN